MMKCLSLTQPWATLVVTGKKRIETRSWSTSYRGPLLIHAAKGFPRWAMELALTEPFRSTLRDIRLPTLGDLPRGAIIGKVALIDCCKLGYVSGINYFSNTLQGVLRVELPPPEPELSFGDYKPGRFAWILDEPIIFDAPIPYRGQLGLFDVPASVLGSVTP